MTWHPLPPDVADWMGMDEAHASSHPTPESARPDPPPVVPQPRRPLVDLTPLIEALEAHLAAFRATHPH